MHILRLLALSALSLAAATLSGCDTAGDGTSDLRAPLLIGPTSNAHFSALSLVEFSWESVPSATAYEFSLEYDLYPSANVSGVVSDTVHVEALTELGPARWRVRARSDETVGPWSAAHLLEVQGTTVVAEGLYNVRFSTENTSVGETLKMTANPAFSTALLQAIEGAGATAEDFRSGTVTAFRISVENPPSTTLDDFSDWTVLLANGSSEAIIMAMTDPAPSFESADVVFQEPENWNELALDPATELVLSVQTNPRTPRAADVNVRIELSLIAELNR